ncbi:MAG: hypothetical protein H7Y17_15685 [Chlorobia bacterium]|nr:hypothetical protein [Fimbriimonadaceae bacterium]
MRETISELVAGKRLVFKMHNTPPSMKEWNPFGEVHAPHLDGYYESLEGSFDLIPLPGGKTLLRGTSIYQHRYRPVTYWSWWTDKIVGEVQLSVMEEVKRRAER